jgi:hypothetical protein
MSLHIFTCHTCENLTFVIPKKCRFLKCLPRTTPFTGRRPAILADKSGVWGGELAVRSPKLQQCQALIFARSAASAGEAAAELCGRPGFPWLIDRAKSAMRGAISARKREPLNTP